MRSHYPLLAVLLLTACGRDEPPEDQRTDSVTSEEVKAARADWPAGVPELVDSANAAYSQQNYAQASALYRRAAQRGPRLPAVWFGIYMAEHALGNSAAADSAILRAQELAPGASLIHAAPADTGRVNPHR
jgi:tetratricopeptide (TPR) repeat protein